METIIEIGDSEQRKLVEQELSVFPEVVTHFDPPLNICKVIIPLNFEERVNELQGTTTYKSTRGLTDLSINALAKVIELDEGIAIVLSPNLFTESHDTQTRYFVYVHELMHVVNRRRFPKYRGETYSEQTYLGNIYTMYDEYLADRMSFEIIDEVFHAKSSFWTTSILNDLSGFAALIIDPKYHETISAEIASYRVHGDVMQFLKHIHQGFDEVALSIAHIYAIIHQYPKLATETDLSKSKFVNEKTLALVAFFRERFERNEFDLHDGQDLLIRFMTNFGFRFEETPQGPYCYVIDI